MHFRVRVLGVLDQFGSLTTKLRQLLDDGLFRVSLPQLISNLVEASQVHHLLSISSAHKDVGELMLIFEFGPEVPDDLLSALGVQIRLDFLEQRDHFHSEEPLSRFELQLSRGLEKLLICDLFLALLHLGVGEGEFDATNLAFQLVDLLYRLIVSFMILLEDHINDWCLDLGAKNGLLLSLECKDCSFILSKLLDPDSLELSPDLFGIQVYVLEPHLIEVFVLKQLEGWVAIDVPAVLSLEKFAMKLVYLSRHLANGDSFSSA